MDKISRERRILYLAKPLLVKIYGKFTIVDSQTDNPDAAIELSPNNRIGVEITSIDPQDIQQYFRDDKFGSDIVAQELELISQEKYSDRPTKKHSIPFPNSYIFDGVEKKAKKYSQYMESGKYNDIILIAFGDYLEIGDSNKFSLYFMPWTWYLLNEVLFPFDKVIYVSERTGGSALVFDKSLPPPKPPKRNPEIEAGITRINGPVLPVGKKVNLKKIFDNDASIKPKQKGRSKKRKRKVQKESRRKNR